MTDLALAAILGGIGGVIGSTITTLLMSRRRAVPARTRTILDAVEQRREWMNAQSDERKTDG